jgi:hypothetical protein
MTFARAKSFALGLAVLPVLFVIAATMTATLSRLILDLGRDTKYSFETTMDGPEWATFFSGAVMLALYGFGLWRFRERLSVRWALCGTFVAPAVTAVLLVVAFLALGGQVGPR